MNATNGYQLPRRRAGGAVLGLTHTQVGLLGAGVAALAGSVAAWGPAGTVTGLALALLAAGLALVPVAGQPLHHLLAVAVSYTLHRRGHLARARRRRHRHSGRSGGPPLTGPVVLRAVPDGHVGTVGVAVDRRARTATVAVEVRAGPFALLDTTGQRRLLDGWARVLAQTARDRGVARVGWTLTTRPTDPSTWTAALPPPVAPGTNDQPPGIAQAAASYRQLLTHAAADAPEHDLLLWLTVDARLLPRRTDPAAFAVAAGHTLASRCHAAGLHVAGPLDDRDLHHAAADRLDPCTTSEPPPPPDPDSLAARLGLVHRPPPLPALTWRDVEIRWDAVRVGGSWHRTFWAAQPPAHQLAPTWLDPLVHDTTGVRTLALVAEPVPARTSRRRINAESVSVDTALALRDKHAFRVPAHLAGAHDDVDRRDAEIHAGYPEYAWTLLLAVAAPDRPALDHASAALADTAARCGLDHLVPLHGRHPAALAATLPLGLAPHPAPGDNR